jgi:hypothetical protein
MPRSRFGGWCLLDGDVLHGAGRTRAVPMLLSRRKPHNSPGGISSTDPPQRCARPTPDVTMSVWPSGCVCQPCASNNGSTRTVASTIPRKRFRDSLPYGTVFETIPVTFTSIETMDGGLAGRDAHQVPVAVTIKAATAELHFHQGTPAILYLGTSYAAS